MATAELAVALPSLIVVLWACLGALRLADAKLRCADAASVVARAYARNDPAAGLRLAAQLAGGPVRVDAHVGATATTVTVRLSVRPLAGLGAITVVDRAVAATESGRDQPSR
jgi:hypothetical protein